MAPIKSIQGRYYYHIYMPQGTNESIDSVHSLKTSCSLLRVPCCFAKFSASTAPYINRSSYIFLQWVSHVWEIQNSELDGRHLSCHNQVKKTVHRYMKCDLLVCVCNGWARHALQIIFFHGRHFSGLGYILRCWLLCPFPLWVLSCNSKPVW